MHILSLQTKFPYFFSECCSDNSPSTSNQFTILIPEVRNYELLSQYSSSNERNRDKKDHDHIFTEDLKVLHAIP